MPTLGLPGSPTDHDETEIGIHRQSRPQSVRGLPSSMHPARAASCWARFWRWNTENTASGEYCPPGGTEIPDRGPNATIRPGVIAEDPEMPTNSAADDEDIQKQAIRRRGTPRNRPQQWHFSPPTMPALSPATISTVAADNRKRAAVIFGSGISF